MNVRMYGILGFAFALLLSFTWPQIASAQTVLVVKNSTSVSVNAVVKLPPSSSFGCGPTQPSQLRATDITNPTHPVAIVVHAISGVPNLGYFAVGGGHSVQLRPSSQFTCLQSLGISFVTLPQCPCGPQLASKGFNSLCSSINHPFGGGPPLPNGVNLAEVTLNVTPSQQETVDISCNQGANSIIKMTLPGSSWTNGITTIQNGAVIVSSSTDQNCSLNGVFPYNLDNCNSGPISCSGGGGEAFCTTFPTVCQAQRTTSGGTVTVTYKGPSLVID